MRPLLLQAVHAILSQDQMLSLAEVALAHLLSPKGGGLIEKAEEEKGPPRPGLRPEVRIVTRRGAKEPFPMKVYVREREKGAPPPKPTPEGEALPPRRVVGEASAPAAAGDPEAEAAVEAASSEATAEFYYKFKEELLGRLKGMLPEDIVRRFLAPALGVASSDWRAHKILHRAVTRLLTIDRLCAARGDKDACIMGELRKGNLGVDTEELLSLLSKSQKLPPELKDAVRDLPVSAVRAAFDTPAFKGLPEREKLSESLDELSKRRRNYQRQRDKLHAALLSYLHLTLETVTEGGTLNDVRKRWKKMHGKTFGVVIQEGVRGIARAGERVVEGWKDVLGKAAAVVSARAPKFGERTPLSTWYGYKAGEEILGLLEEGYRLLQGGLEKGKSPAERALAFGKLRTLNSIISAPIGTISSTLLGGAEEGILSRLKAHVDVLSQLRTHAEGFVRGTLPPTEFYKQGTLLNLKLLGAVMPAKRSQYSRWGNILKGMGRASLSVFKAAFHLSKMLLFSTLDKKIERGGAPPPEPQREKVEGEKVEEKGVEDLFRQYREDELSSYISFDTWKQLKRMEGASPEELKQFLEEVEKRREIDPNQLFSKFISHEGKEGSLPAEIEHVLRGVLLVHDLPQLPIDIKDRRSAEAREREAALARYYTDELSIHLLDTGNSVPHELMHSLDHLSCSLALMDLVRKGRGGDPLLGMVRRVMSEVGLQEDDPLTLDNPKVQEACRRLDGYALSGYIHKAASLARMEHPLFLALDRFKEAVKETRLHSYMREEEKRRKAAGQEVDLTSTHELLAYFYERWLLEKWVGLGGHGLEPPEGVRPLLSVREGKILTSLPWGNTLLREMPPQDYEKVEKAFEGYMKEVFKVLGGEFRLPTEEAARRLLEKVLSFLLLLKWKV